ncbi:hypothetical protein BD413DRAFT_643822 [Trametes elegans]|nr:hypothetical protein BD413DRAFT_643822 [Trametes elegans]
MRCTLIRPASLFRDGISPSVITHNERFYSDHVVFLVEDQLFKVPKRNFVDDSEVFRDMFSLPIWGTTAEGQTDEEPLLLEGVEIDDFYVFLRVMFDPYYLHEETEPKLTKEHWTAVLKLATKWQFTRLRLSAIKNLRPLLSMQNAVEWICLSRQYGVGEWLCDALYALMQRSAALTLAEAELLGLNTVVQMGKAREEYIRSSGSSKYYSGFTDPRARVRQLFADELQDCSK